MENKVQMYSLVFSDGRQTNPIIIQTTPEKAKVISQFVGILEEWEEWNERDLEPLSFEPVEERSLIFTL